MANHQPVLVEKVIEYLLGGERELFLDCTLGSGGHTAALLEAAGKPIRIFAFDKDPEAVKAAAKNLEGRSGVIIDQGDYSQLDTLAVKCGITLVDGIFADLGQSSMQLDDPERGFSHRFDGPLDMRYNQSDDLSASEIVNSMTKDQLIDILGFYGQERKAKAIALAIVRSRPIKGTSQLAALIRKVCPADHIEKTLARVFMALRVAVNDELSSIEQFLCKALVLLRKTGRLVLISYDSNQDRIVKRFFREKSLTCTCPPKLPVCVCGKIAELKVLTPHVVIPGSMEIKQNPRSRSARLRAAEKVANAHEKTD